ncbi:dienelactone hydrolase family protein [Histidinibacterium lentulum]|uniref:Dienelactone hydrolase n=1 Tax=Histidinibacterium lentulum TaxID=2480588 RepID=A0A3N2R8X6_9RHOB|nr:dienelactone hydrolase family protein [Histidinibacterium lentulum]ROU03929.1 dienelactone hydrolase [Histidinibacterium lentulum]
MTRWKRRLIWALAVVALLFSAVTLNSFRGRLGWSAVALDPGELLQDLAPEMVWTLPEGEGPHPVAMLLSGCDGPRRNLDLLARELAGIGWASVKVDSHTPRGLGENQLWRLVCTGQLLNGAERASDVAVTLAEIRSRAELDAGRAVLIGLSHGGWASLDFLALSAEGVVPPLLTGWPAALASPPHTGVVGAVLYYPYCGPAAVGYRGDLPEDPRYLFLLVEGDMITNEERCLEIAGGLRAAGAEVGVHTFTGVTHGFDQQEKSDLSLLEFDPAARAEAVAMTLDFLRDL